MFIKVATGTIGDQPQVCLSQSAPLGKHALRRKYVLRIVALSAIEGFMLSFQSITGFRMIELLPTAFPKYQFKVSPMVFHVTEIAFDVIVTTVQPGLADKTRFYRRVTSKAVIGENLLFRAVTLAAIAHSFEKSMRLMKVAG